MARASALPRKQETVYLVVLGNLVPHAEHWEHSGKEDRGATVLQELTSRGCTQ